MLESSRNQIHLDMFFVNCTNNPCIAKSKMTGKKYTLRVRMNSILRGLDLN
jgi:hypothetical protein